MEFAKNSNGKLVRARDALRTGYYSCPVCHGEVYLKYGSLRVPHFAHYQSTANANCELYYPGPGEYVPTVGKSALGSGGQQVELVSPLRVSIEVFYPTRRKAEAPNWGLRVTVPKAPDSDGQIEIDLGGQSPKRVSLRKLAEGSQTYPASPDRLQFKAKRAKGSVPDNFLRGVSLVRPGLHKRKITPFSSLTSKLQPRTTTVHCGESYYFVWHADTDIDLPESLSAVQLEDLDLWKCALVELPISPSREIEEWFNKYCDLNLRHAKTVSSVIWPHLYEKNAFDGLEIAGEGSLVLGFFDPTGECHEVDGNLTLISGDRQTSNEFSLAPPQLCHFEVREKSRLTVEVEGFGSTTAVVVPVPSDKYLPEVSLEFLAKQGSRKIPLHSPRVCQELDRVRKRESRLTAIEFPQFARGEIRWCETGTASWDNFEISSDKAYVVSDSGHLALDVETIEFINESLLDRRKEILIDFATLGQRHIPDVQDDVNESARPTIKDPELRSRIVWLLKQTPSNSRIFKTISAQPPDDKLIDALLEFDPPRHLMAHHRTLLARVGHTPL